jgi:hypothetical protein
MVLNALNSLYFCGEKPALLRDVRGTHSHQTWQMCAYEQQFLAGWKPEAPYRILVSFTQ